VRNLGFLALRRAVNLVVVLAAALVPAAIGQTTAGCAEKPCAYMECGQPGTGAAGVATKFSVSGRMGCRSSRARGGLECGLVLG
jgi:hypothetical protein